jgi:hypothetical protein
LTRKPVRVLLVIPVGMSRRDSAARGDTRGFSQRQGGLDSAASSSQAARAGQIVAAITRPAAAPGVLFAGFAVYVRGFWWWIRAWRWIGCIRVHRIDHGTRNHRGNRSGPPSGVALVRSCDRCIAGRLRAP